MTTEQKLQAAITAIENLVTAQQQFSVDWAEYNEQLTPAITSIVESKVGGISPEQQQALELVALAYQQADTSIKSQLQSAFTQADTALKNQLTAIIEQGDTSVETQINNSISQELAALVQQLEADYTAADEKLKDEVGGGGVINLSNIIEGVDDSYAGINAVIVNAEIAKNIGRSFTIQDAFYVNSTIDISGVNVHAPSRGFKAAVGMTGAVVSSSNVNNTTAADSDIRIIGNASSSTAMDGTNIGLLLERDRSPMATYTVRVSSSDVGLRVNGDTEKKVINLHVAYCKSAYQETVVGGSPDELITTITGTRCERWYETEGEVSSNVRFNVESNVDTSDNNHYCVINKGGKSVTMAGEIRGTKNGCIRLTKVESGTTTWQDATHFDDLKLIQVDKGIGLYMERCQRVTGQIVLYDCQNDNGSTLFIGEVQDMGGFRPVVNKCFSLYGVQIGSSYTAPTALDITLSVSMGDVYGTDSKDLTALYVNKAQLCTINMELCEGNIMLDGAIDCTLLLPASFARGPYTVTGGNGSTHVIINGLLSVEQASRISWRDNVASITLRVLKGYGGPVIYANGAWSLAKTLTGNSIDFECRNSDINTFFKATGAPAFSNDDKVVYRAAGYGYTQSWLDYLGNPQVSPGIISETASLLARLPVSGLSTAEIDIYDRLLYDLKTAGLINKIHCLYVFMGSSKANALKNIIQDNYHLVDSNGSTTHTAFAGIYGGDDGSGRSYSDTGFDMASLNQSSFSIGCLTLVTDSDSEQDMETANDAVRLRTRASSGSYIRMACEDENQLGMLTSTTPANPPRLVTGTRNGPAQSIYADGVLSDTNSITNSRDGNTMHINRTTRPNAAVFIADYLTASEVAAMADALSTYRVGSSQLI
ncbi:hypothetical protein [Paraglaciecola agarilytica]|uniref:hypothetical protein n=1 Tax=Paraglaciecola chathamensis TaxID=368405 RepID=UPI002354EF11|nr:hypothetical protein [Paraglaciecola agarilytica]|tara:strand:- start:78778 stop:81414 length:2637 start_codon:yes stop_codon:yes gene_type:complete